MADLNKVFLLGRLTFDPELRHTSGGSSVTELRLAVNRSWLDRDGNKKEEALFIDVSVWGKQAEFCSQYLRKGSNVHVEGYLKNESWEDKTTGEKRSKIRVQAERVQFLDPRSDDQSSARSDDAPAPSQPAAPVQATPAAQRPNTYQRPPQPAASASSRPQPQAAYAHDDSEDIPF